MGTIPSTSVHVYGHFGCSGASLRKDATGHEENVPLGELRVWRSVTIRASVYEGSGECNSKRDRLGGTSWILK